MQIGGGFVLGCVNTAFGFSFRGHGKSNLAVHQPHAH